MDYKLTFPGGDPNLSIADILFMQYSNYDTLQSIGSELHMGVIDGCVITWDAPDYTAHTVNLYMSAGHVVINGRIVQVDAQSFHALSIPNNVPASGTGEYRFILTPTVTYNSVGDKTFADGTPRQTMQQTRGILSFNGYATDPLSTQLEIGSLIWTYSPLSNNIYQSHKNLYPIHTIADTSATTKINAYNTNTFGTLTNGDICVVNGSGKIEATRKTIIDAGNKSNYDFSSLTKDGSWHDLDLSSLVPAGFSMVLLRIFVSVDPTTSPMTGNLIQLRTKGNSNVYNISEVHPQVAGVPILSDNWVFLDANRFIQYNVTGCTTGSVNNVTITVGAWL